MNNRHNYYIKLILYFFIFAFAGWLLETAYGISQLGYFTKRGFLYGPICPIYGFGALILIIFLSKYRKHSLKLFVLAAVVCSAFEYFVGFVLDALFADKWWDYSTEFLNLNGRISILYTFAWGVIAIVFVNFIFPFIEKHLNKKLNNIPFKYQKVFTIVLLATLATDITFSCIKYLK